MPYKIDPQTRSRMMSKIRGKDTSQELIIRKELHRLGFRYVLHSKKLPGKPDLVFPKFKAVIFINGCFWHGHHCHIFKWPKTRPEFWRLKFAANKTRDKQSIALCNQKGWKVLTVWECATKGRTRRQKPEITHTIANWLFYDNQNAELEGHIDTFSLLDTLD